MALFEDLNRCFNNDNKFIQTENEIKSFFSEDDFVIEVVTEDFSHEFGIFLSDNYIVHMGEKTIQIYSDDISYVPSHVQLDITIHLSVQIRVDKRIDLILKHHSHTNEMINLTYEW